MSLVLRPPGTEPMPPALSLLAGVAVCDVAGAGARVKWPNDVVREGPGGPAKLGGILVEGRPREGWAVLGIGLNVAVDLGELPAELRGTAATLGRPRGEIEPTLTALLGALQRRLREPVGEVLDAWRARDALRGREIRWAGGAGALAGREAEDRPGSARGERHGVAEGIDGEGRLIVALPGGGRTALDAGEVHLAGTQVYSFGG
jgi:BirA family biotin operon repressor/biotin-[acetyl-CoA-carboxylase] ligase